MPLLSGLCLYQNAKLQGCSKAEKIGGEWLGGRGVSGSLPSMSPPHPTFWLGCRMWPRYNWSWYRDGHIISAEPISPSTSFLARAGRKFPPTLQLQAMRTKHSQSTVSPAWGKASSGRKDDNTQKILKEKWELTAQIPRANHQVPSAPATSAIYVNEKTELKCI